MKGFVGVLPVALLLGLSAAVAEPNVGDKATVDADTSFTQILQPPYRSLSKKDLYEEREYEDGEMQVMFWYPEFLHLERCFGTRLRLSRLRFRRLRGHKCHRAAFHDCIHQGALSTVRVLSGPERGQRQVRRRT